MLYCTQHLAFDADGTSILEGLYGEGESSMQVAVTQLRVDGTCFHLLPPFYEEISRARTAALTHPNLVTVYGLVVTELPCLSLLVDPAPFTSGLTLFDAYHTLPLPRYQRRSFNKSGTKDPGSGSRWRR